MRVIYRKVCHARYLYIKRNVEKVWGARNTLGARYLSKNTVISCVPDFLIPCRCSSNICTFLICQALTFHMQRYCGCRNTLTWFYYILLFLYRGSNKPRNAEWKCFVSHLVELRPLVQALANVWSVVVVCRMSDEWKMFNIRELLTFPSRNHIKSISNSLLKSIPRDSDCRY